MTSVQKSAHFRGTSKWGFGCAIGLMVAKIDRSEVGPKWTDFCTEVTRKMTHLEEASGGLRRDMRLSKVHVHVRKFKAPHRNLPIG